jgi:hypothetical protein
MRWALPFLPLALAALQVQAQQVRGSFNPDSTYQTNVQLAHGKLLTEVQLLTGPVGKLPPAMQRDLLVKLRQVNGELDDFGRLLANRPDRDRLRKEFEPIDRDTKDLIYAARLQSSMNVPMQTVTARVSSALLQLAFAIDAGDKPVPLPGPGPGRPGFDLPRRLARQLESQAAEMRSIAKRELPAEPNALKIDRGLASVASAASRLAWTLALLRQGGAAAARFAELRSAWQSSAADIKALQRPPGSQLRMQASQFDRDFRNLARLIDPSVDPDPEFNILPPIKEQRLIALSAGPGGTPMVRLFQEHKGLDSTDFMAYDASFRGGVRVALGDVNGDGVADIVTVPGPGMPPLVRVFDGRDLSLINEFMAYDSKWLNGVFVAVGDLNRNGRCEIITGADAGGSPHVRIFDGRTGKFLRDFMAYDRDFAGGVRVATGDVNGDGSMNIITAPGKGMPPLVRVVDVRTMRVIGEFMAYDPKMDGGVWVTAADMTHNGRAEIITGADQGGPHVRIFRGLRGDVLFQFFAYDMSLKNGVRVAVHDVNRDGKLDIITVPGPGMPALVRVFDGRRDFAQVQEFVGLAGDFRGGGFIATR